MGNNTVENNSHVYRFETRYVARKSKLSISNKENKGASVLSKRTSDGQDIDMYYAANKHRESPYACSNSSLVWLGRTTANATSLLFKKKRNGFEFLRTLFALLDFQRTDACSYCKTCWCLILHPDSS
jgi:hypothetical protein